ncbi:uncharacterized protein PFL1_06415 [Pseudozyma flocculosa PF-1]|uniref:Large ribosomal subunit protein mL44 n=2 Tax=Pseudozyma flocculosa TaxID=84751 RepID=A0A5C3EXC1_9BASI|nr:uncharacterized protein PFL1_06415 [Pseudozyma flocculosa PF-1]EPQ25959.1 hypothetical protein PFL1_06415 [Pseudozyma flocculosa PF-1]SPO35741.1 related to MRPL3 - Mitochondrial ribosomal protein, large subunit [Pseudozyma flocculosa]
MSSSRSVARAARPLLQHSSSAPRLRSATPSTSAIAGSSSPLASSSAASSSAASSSSSSSSSASSSALHTSSHRAASPAAVASTAVAGGASSSPLDRHAPASHLPQLARKDAALYAALRPPPLSAVAALAARLNLLPASLDAPTRSRRIQLVYQACTHPSFQELVKKAAEQGGLHLEVSGAGLVRKSPEANPLDSLQYLPQQIASPDADAPAAADAGLANRALSTVGNSLLGMMASEYLHLRYPNLPTRVLKAAVAAYVGPSTLADVAGEIGLGGQGILRWNRQARVPTRSAPAPTKGDIAAKSAPSRTRGLLSRDVSADAMRALVAVIFQELGLSAARHFITTHFLSRNLDLASLLKFADPKRALSATCAKHGREAPQSRLIAESGRLSINPIFVVGVYSGMQKVGEGSGSSIRMAEYRAAEDALRRLFLAQTPIEDLNLPSTTLDAVYGPKDGRKPFIPSSIPVYDGAGKTYSPLPLGACEVLEAAGKDRQ